MSVHYATGNSMSLIKLKRTYGKGEQWQVI